MEKILPISRNYLLLRNRYLTHVSICSSCRLISHPTQDGESSYLTLSRLCLDGQAMLEEIDNYLFPSTP